MLTHLRADRISYVVVQMALQRADAALGGGRFAGAIADNFAWREIGQVAVGPYLGTAGMGPSALQLGVHRCAKRWPSSRGDIG